MSSPTAPPPHITLYTHHGCGWSHRVHITLYELGLAHDEVHIDLDNPRPDWFLALNPRGLVPVMHYRTAHVDEILTESGPIVTFLMDLHPSHLQPGPGTNGNGKEAEEAALFRYRATFLIDAYFSKVNPLMFKLLGGTTREEQEERVDALVDMVAKEVEPLLVKNKDLDGQGVGGMYFGGRAKLTVVEVMITPFVMRVYEFADDVIWPRTVVAKLDALPAFSKWARLCMKQASVLHVWDEDLRERIVERLPAAKAKYADVAK